MIKHQARLTKETKGQNPEIWEIRQSWRQNTVRPDRHKHMRQRQDTKRKQTRVRKNHELKLINSEMLSN